MLISRVHHHARPLAPEPDQHLALGGRRDRLRRPHVRGGLPLGARGADRPAAHGVRLVPRRDLVGGVGQPRAQRRDLAVRGGADGALRDAPRRHRRAAARRGGQRADGVRGRALAADPALGRLRRGRHRGDRAGVRRDGDRTLVRQPPRPGQRGPDRRAVRRWARLPAADGLAREQPRLATGLPRRHRGRARRRARRRVPAARPPERRRNGRAGRSAGRPRRAGRRRHHGPRGAPSARRSRRCATPRAPGCSGCSRAASRSAGRRRSGW